MIFNNLFRAILSICTMFFVLCSYAQNTETKKVQQFSLPEIPSMLTTPQERADFLVTHYWDNFDFTDTSLISKPEITEQAFVDYLDLLPLVSNDLMVNSITNVLDVAISADSLMFACFTEMSDKYMHDTNSPFRNEEFYIPVLQYILSSPKIADVYKIRPQYQLEMALKNRVGTEASDFVYTLRNGKEGTLHSIKSKYTIVFFNNPDCEDCKLVKEYMANSFVINELLGGTNLSPKELTILALYPDADLPKWLSEQYPKKWINAYDATLKVDRKHLYDLRTIPSLYLLDKDKRVILKDATIENIEAKLIEFSCK